jgi:effector-binding domain-containing protein
MFKIGDFSKLTRVSVKGLRYYDDLGLLKPAHIDESSGYRYYSADQLPQLNRILALKDLGLTLEQIGKLLKTGLSAQELRGMLRMKQAELQERISEERGLLGRVEVRLQQIEQEDDVANVDVVIKKVEPVLVASVRDTIANYPSIGGLFQELMGNVYRQGSKPAGPAIAVWHDQEMKESHVDGEAAIPIEKPIQESGRVKVYELPGVESAACLVHHGSFQKLQQAYDSLMTWIEQNGYTITGPLREVYLYTGEGEIKQDDESYVTEIQAPVVKV